MISKVGKYNTQIQEKGIRGIVGIMKYLVACNKRRRQVTDPSRHYARASNNSSISLSTEVGSLTMADDPLHVRSHKERERGH